MLDQTRLTQAYADATRRWPGVSWPVEHYQSHLNGEAPPHAGDLYLSGAAGYRVDAAWALIETEFGPEVVRILKRLPTADYSLDDLWGDTRQKLIDDHPADDDPLLPDLPEDAGQPGARPAKIIRYRGKVPLVNYMVLAARRLAISRKRQMQSRCTTLSLSGGGGGSGDDEDRPWEQPDSAAADPAEEAWDNEVAEALVRCLSNALDELSTEQRFLLRMVYDRGMMQKDAGQMLGWSPFKTSRQLKEATQRLGAALESAFVGRVNLASSAVKEAWGKAWASHWREESMQADRVGASEGVG